MTTKDDIKGSIAKLVPRKIDYSIEITSREHKELEEAIVAKMREEYLSSLSANSVEESDRAYDQYRASEIYARKFLDALTIPQSSEDGFSYRIDANKYASTNFHSAFIDSPEEERAARKSIEVMVEDMIKAKITSRDSIITDSGTLQRNSPHVVALEKELS